MNILTWLSSSCVGYMICQECHTRLTYTENIVSCVSKSDTYMFLTQRTALLSISEKIYYITRKYTIHPITNAQFAHVHVSWCPPGLLFCLLASGLCRLPGVLTVLGSSESLMLILVSGWLSFMLNTVFCKLKPQSHFWALSNCLPLHPCLFSFFFNILHGFTHDLPGLQRPCAKPRVLSFPPRLHLSFMSIL